jgi:hypothetical protein
MTTFLKVLWIIATALNFILLAYFWIGATAFFNRAPGASWGYYLVFIGFPVMFLILVSILCLIFGWIPRETSIQIVLAVVIISVTLFNIYVAPLPIEPYTIRVDALRHSPSSEIIVQTTEDGKYEYFLEVINSSQRNSSARLFVRNVVTGEEVRIPLNMRNERITFSLGATPNEADAWSHLVLSETSSTIYILTTTWFLNDIIESFEINMETKTSQRLE